MESVFSGTTVTMSTGSRVAMLCFCTAAPLVQPRSQTRCSGRPTSRKRYSIQYRCNLAMSTPGPGDLLIIGAGLLGRQVAAKWLEENPESVVVGETLSSRAHTLLSSEGISPAIVGSSTEKFHNVVFSAPPTSKVDYPKAAKSATIRVAPGGCLVFTSSGSVYGPSPTFACETSPVDDEWPRSARIAAAERSILEVSEGHVLRCPALYAAHRGAHSFLIDLGIMTMPADVPINAVAYSDAAEAVVKLLKKGPRVQDADRSGKRIYLASAEYYVSRRRMIEIALQHPLFVGKREPDYSKAPAGVFKRYDNSWTRETLQWKPEWESFDEFMEEDAKKRRRNG